MIIDIDSLDLEIQYNITEAVNTSKLAQSSYYGYKVCAMIVDENGNKYKGVNFEPSNGKSICAETTALGTYLLSEKKRIKYMIVYGAGADKEKRENVFCLPCGSCRQMLSDFVSSQTIIYGVNESANKVNKVTLEELLPFAFGNNNL